MFIRTIRQQKRMSQELLAESSGLSLRTVQRVESGHRVSYASLRAIANALEIDVDRLELELYAVDKSGGDYREIPLWVRLILGRGGLSSDRSELHRAEIILAVLGVGLGLLWAVNIVWPIVYDPQGGILHTSLVMLLFAYGISISIRVGDKYAARSKSEQSFSWSFFGLIGKD